MIEGFVKIDRHEFYVKYWPKIQVKGDVVKSNLKEFKKGEADTLVIHWGYKEAGKADHVILAVSENKRGQRDEHWVSPQVHKSVK